MQPNEVFMLPGNGELWLLERAKCGLGRDSILSTYRINKRTWRISGNVSQLGCAYLRMDGELHFISLTECIGNVNEKRRIVV